MKSMLLFGETTLIHDNLLWNYPVFQFFAENIINGHFPFWNPFDHGGEPFYPILGHVRLLEPIALLIIYFGHFICNDIVLLFNWHHFIKSLIMVVGVYIVFRPFAANLFIRLSLIPILLYSSLFLGSFREDFTTQFFWVPFITYFLLRIIYYKDYRWHNWFLLASLIGLNWQSYFFTGTWIFLLFLSLGILFFNRNLLAELFKAKMVVLKLSVTAVIIFAMAMPNIVLMLEKSKYVFPARMVDASLKNTAKQSEILVMQLPYEAAVSSTVVDSINMPYYFIASTGTFSTIWDFIQIISPDGNNYVGWPSRTGWGEPSEAYMYLGFLPWAIALLGLVAGRHDLKRLWLLILLAFGLLMLGPPGGLHRLLYYIYPPVWFLRHTHVFVLFFLFTLLYFYILGFNHIFYTWEGRVFSSYNSQGFLSRFIKSDKVCKALALSIFSAPMVGSVYFMTKIQYPVTNYLFGFIVLIVVSGWVFRRDLGEKGLYASLIISHIIIILIFSTNTLKFIGYILPALGLPLALFIFIKSREGFSLSRRRYAPLILLSVFSVSLTSDLVYSLKMSSLLYQGEKHPNITLNIKTAPQKPFLPQNRLVETHNYTAYSEQGVRYLSLAYRQPFVFSPLMGPDYSASYVHVKNSFSGLVNQSFENWIVSPDGSLLPKQFTYHQDGGGGRVVKNTDFDGLKDGSISVLLAPSTAGNSYIKYQTSQIEEIRGQYVRLSLWLKSRNKSHKAIKAEMQIDNGPVVSNYYNNTGDWERLIVGRYIDKSATKLTITCNTNSAATAPVYLDGFTVEIVEIKPDEIDDVLKSKRWSSLLLLKKYFALINMDIPPLAFREIFAVGKPMFQFKNKVVEIKESETAVFLKMLGSHKSVELLREAVLVDDQIDRSLTRFIKLPQEYQNDNQNSTAERIVKKEKDISGKDGKSKFAYTIENYNYNSFEMKASTDNEGILYWADGYDKNWHAYINGKEVPIYRANVNFKAISLPQGASTISFVYDPFWFKSGLFVFYGVFILSILLAVLVSMLSKDNLKKY